MRRPAGIDVLDLRCPPGWVRAEVPTPQCLIDQYTMIEDLSQTSSYAWAMLGADPCEVRHRINLMIPAFDTAWTNAVQNVCASVLPLGLAGIEVGNQLRRATETTFVENCSGFGFVYEHVPGARGLPPTIRTCVPIVTRARAVPLGHLGPVQFQPITPGGLCDFPCRVRQFRPETMDEMFVKFQQALTCANDSVPKAPEGSSAAVVELRNANFVDTFIECLDYLTATDRLRQNFNLLGTNDIEDLFELIRDSDSSGEQNFGASVLFTARIMWSTLSYCGCPGGPSEITPI